MVDRDADLDRVDCLQFSEDDEGTVRVVPAGMDEQVVAAHREEGRRRNRVAMAATVILTLLTGAGAVVVLGPSPTVAAGTLLVGGASLYAVRRSSPEGGAPAPALVATDLPTAEARDRYEVAVASATPFGSDGIDRRSS